MANLLIAEPSLSDAAGDAYQVTGGGGEQAAAPARNLFLRQPKEVFESVNVSSTIDLRFDMGLAAPIPTSYNVLALLFTNATLSATVTFDGDTIPSMGSPDWTSGAISPAGGQTYFTRRHFFYKIPTTQTARYVRVRISDATNPETVFRAGRFYCCAAYTPTLNVQYPLGRGFHDPSTETVTTAGERITRPAEIWPKLQFTMQASGSTAEAEFEDGIYELMRRVGSARDVLVCTDPADTTYLGRKLYYGTLQQTTSVSLADYRFYQAGFELTGMI